MFFLFNCGPNHFLFPLWPMNLFIDLYRALSIVQFFGSCGYHYQWSGDNACLKRKKIWIRILSVGDASCRGIFYRPTHNWPEVDQKPDFITLIERTHCGVLMRSKIFEWSFFREHVGHWFQIRANSLTVEDTIVSDSVHKVACRIKFQSSKQRTDFTEMHVSSTLTAPMT